MHSFKELFLVYKVGKMNYFESEPYNLLGDKLSKLTSPISIVDAGVKEIKKIWHGLSKLRFQSHTEVNRLTNNDRVNTCNEETYDVFKHTSDRTPCRSLKAPIINSVDVVNGTNQLHIRWSNAYGLKSLLSRKHEINLKYNVVYYRKGERLSVATTTDTFYQTGDLCPGLYTVMVEVCDHSGNGVFSMPFACMISAN